MEEHLPDILLIVFFVLFSSYFSATETAFSSFNRIRMKNAASKGDKKAKLTMDLAERFDSVLSTILIGNNIVNIAATSIATTMFVSIFGNMGATLSTVVMTVILLIFGEISPKSIANNMPDTISKLSAPILRIFCIVLMPLNVIFSLWQKMLSKIFKNADSNKVTEEEILTMVEEAQSEGGIDEKAGELIKSAIEFEDCDAVEVCTPRTEIVGIERRETVENIMKTFQETGFSRLPVYEKTTDNIIGILNEKDFYQHVITGGKRVESVLHQPIFVNANTKISRLMQKLQSTHNHISILVDEYGGTVGIVTLEDIIEELVGEIWDERDEETKEIVKISENSYRVAGWANLDELFELLNIDTDLDFVTVNGWVLDCFEGIPKVGDTFEYKNLKVSVKKATQKRVTEVVIEVEDPKEEEKT
ncbi:MAG: hemolysin family protein [Lachnospiraceae bacterium]|nr:hemolysin family protein [Lachnospiraceae bacterium]